MPLGARQRAASKSVTLPRASGVFRAGPNLPDVQSASYQIGQKQYDFTAEYQADTQTWRYRHGDAPLAVYHRNGAFKQTGNAKRARYTCFQSAAAHFCARKLPAPFW